MRDELRRNFAAWLDEWRYCPACDVQLQRSTGTEFVPTWHRHEDDCVLAGILALLATQEAPPILSRKHADEIAYFLRRPDMAHDAKRERLASLVERWTALTARLRNVGSARPAADHDLVIDDAKREAEAHVEQLRAGGYEGAVIQEVYLRAEAAVRDALDAIKKAHAVVDDLCNGRRWTMSVPARPDADPDLVIGDALTKAERVIRSLADVPAQGAGE